METIVEKLKEFGFNSYEAKVYLALLKKYPATGYEISQIADIPQSRAYDALKSLLCESIVFSTGDKPLKYNPISPKELTQRLKRKINSNIDFLEKKLPQVKENYNEPIHTISGYDKIIEKLNEIITNAKDSIYLEIWYEDFKLVEKAVTNAYNRGVDVKIVGFGNFDYIFGLVYRHEGTSDIHYVKNRRVHLIADNSESIFGQVEAEASWTQNKDIAFIVKEFIVHDMYLLDIYEKFPEQLKYFYGSGFKKLKDKILDKKSGYNIH